jgi:hypothetical protein
LGTTALKHVLFQANTFSHNQLVHSCFTSYESKHVIKHHVQK